MAVAPTGGEATLRKNSIGLLDVLFQSITFMAPGVGLVFSLGGGLSFTGTTLPLSVIIALGGCTAAAIAIGQLAKEIPSAGGLYTYAARALSPSWGFLIGWIYVGFAIFLPPFLILQGAVIFGGFLGAHGYPSNAYLIAGVLVAAFFFLTYFDVRLSARSGIILGLIEISVFVLLSFTLMKDGTNSTAPFLPSNSAQGYSGIFEGAVFGVLAFIGFEAAAALGEEAKDPKRTVPVGVVASCVVIGLYYVLTSYAWNAGTDMNILGAKDNSWLGLAGSHWGNTGSWVVMLALLNSVLAAGSASINNAARVVYALGRTGAMPGVGKVHPKHRTPHIAVIFTLVMSSIVSLFCWLKFPHEGALVAFVPATLFTILAIFVYMISCVACIKYFTSGSGKARRNTLLHVVIPIVGLLAFVLPLYVQFFDLDKLFKGDIFKQGPSYFYPLTWGEWGAIIWMVIGAGVLAYFKSSRADQLERATQIFGGEDSLDAGHAEALSLTH